MAKVRKEEKTTCFVEAMSESAIESIESDYQVELKGEFEDANQNKSTTPDKEKSDLEAQSEGPQNDIQDIPDGGYGWFIVLLCFLFNFATWGANSGFAVYLSHYLNNNTFSGGDKYDYALIGGLTFGTGLFFAPFINKIQGAIGIQYTALLGVFMQFTSLILASFVTRLWQLYLTQGVLQAFGLAFMTVPALLILPQWFKHKRTFAGAISAAGSGCGGIMFNLAMQKIIEIRSVHWALRAQAILCVFLGTCATLLIRTRMEVKYSIFDTQVVFSGGFVICAFYLTFCMFGYVIVLYTMANVTTSLGYTPYQGSIASAMVQAGSIIGRPLVGRLSDHFGAITVACGAYILCAILVFSMWIPASNYATIIAFCVLMGALMGTVFAISPSMNSKLYGLKKASVGLCLSWVFLAILGIASPVIGIALKTGNNGFVGASQYRNSAIFAGASFAACAMSLLIMRGYIIYRHEIAGLDADKGHLHITVPFWAPIKYALARASKI